MKFPSSIRTVASRFGCDLPPSPRFGRVSALAPTLPPVSVQIPVSQMPILNTAGAAPTGAVKPAPAKRMTIAEAATKATAPVKKDSIVTAPIVFKYVDEPGNTAKAVAAIQTADKIMNDPSVKNGQAVVEATRGIAVEAMKENSELDPELKKQILDGAAVLEAAEQIRKHLATEPGRPVIPVQTPQQAAAVNDVAAESAYFLTPEDIAALSGTVTRKNWWDRFVEWLASL